MKTLKYIILSFALAVTAVSCADLDLDPKGLLYDNVLLGSDNGIQKYLALVYQDLPIEDFNYKQNGDMKGFATVNQSGWHSGNKWEAQKGSPATAGYEALGRDPEYGDGWGYWCYDRIRDINVMIEKLPGFYEEGKTLNEYLGEARFLRAFYYFGMVKRYGGIPIVRTVLDPLADPEELKQPRDTEYDCWKFIQEDLEFAMANAADRKDAPWRASRYAAAALMSRAMIYAGSIAKYGGYIQTSGEAVEKGLMGMDADKAVEFFQAAYDACKMLEDAGYKLHTGSADKVQNYLDVFGKINAGEEDIFIKQYGSNTVIPTNTSLFHCWDTMILPLGTGMASSVGCALQPNWETISLFQIPAIVDADDQPVRFGSPSDFWNNDEMEARCKAVFFFSGMVEPVSGTTIDVQAGVYKSFAGLTASIAAEGESGADNDFNKNLRVRTDGAGNRGETKLVDGQEVKISGVHGMTVAGGDEGRSYTGAFIRKYTDYQGLNSSRQLFSSQQPWKVFRYGEILCNWAEAAYELGLETGNTALMEEAFEHVAELRSRAGAAHKAMVANPEEVGMDLYGFSIDENLQFIRDERGRELCYENHRVFDLRRWRVADVMFQDGKKSHTLSLYYVIDENKYIFLNEEPVENRKCNFYKRWYYEQIPAGEIGKNDLLIRNDGY